jgi:hypothetical protein
MTRDEVKSDLTAKIDALQVWFASKPYGWRERATAEQVQQWDDRSREQDYLTDRLAMLND